MTPQKSIQSPALTRSPIGQRGGFGVGLIVGLLIGLSLALGVALYVTKVPIPFVNKVPQRSPAQDAAETEKNKNWDPNSPLYGKNPARPSTSATGKVTPDTKTEPQETPVVTPPVATAPVAAPVAPMPPVAPPTPTAPPTPAPAAAPAPRAPAVASTRDPAAILADKPAPASAKASASAAANTSDPFTYLVQAGAYGTVEDAEQQRAKLAMMGLEAKLTEREQAGRTVHRVRLGPFDKKADADAAKEKLTSSGIDAALVRVQR